MCLRARRAEAALWRPVHGDILALWPRALAAQARRAVPKRLTRLGAHGFDAALQRLVHGSAF
eukprot:4157331-Alexandrium_andersonii.AAC.1